MKRMKILMAFAAAFWSYSPLSLADVNLVDKNDWKVNMNGFVEMDMISDSVKGFSESVGNAPVSQSTYNQHTDTMQFSARDSRLAFSVIAPKTDGFNTRGYYEFDFLGYSPQPPGPTGGANSETSLFNNAVPRARQLYLATEKDDWQFLAGQAWSLVGWQSLFVPTTLSVWPVSGTLFARSAQLSAVKTMDHGDQRFQIGFALSRPGQRDSGSPNIDVGLKWSDNALKSFYTSTYSDSKEQPLTVAFSGSYRRVEVATVTKDSHDIYNGSVIAADILVPILSDLTFTSEYSIGRGDGDLFPSWTGNLSAFTDSANRTNLDAGIGGFASDGTFELLQLRSWNAQLQYHLPENFKSFFDFGHTSLHSPNIATYSSVASGSPYSSAETTYFNFVHECTKQIRVGLEYDYFVTRYVNTGNAADRRIMFASYFRF